MLDVWLIAVHCWKALRGKVIEISQPDLNFRMGCFGIEAKWL